MPRDDFFTMIEDLEAWGRYPAWRRRVWINFGLLAATIIIGIIIVALLP